MAAMIQGAIGERDGSKWLPWVILAGVLLYTVGYLDSSLHGVVAGPVVLGYVHEFFHHARHVALMCH